MNARYSFPAFLFALYVLIGVCGLTLWSAAPVLAQSARRPVGNLMVENVPDIPPALLERYEQYQNTRSASFADWDADGKGMYISTRFGDVAQIHHLEHPGGYREQVTFFKEPVSNVFVCPDSARHGFIFAKDQGGNENYQLYFFDRSTGSTQLLTDGKSRNRFPVWNKKGDRFLYSSSKRNGADADFYMRDLAAGSESKLILQNKGGDWEITDWSDDESKALVRNYLSVNDAKIFLLDLKSGALEQIHPTAEPVAYSAPRFAKDGKGIYVISDEGAEFGGLVYYNFQNRQLKKLAAPNGDVEALDLSADGKTVAYSVNIGGYSKLFLLNGPTGVSREVSGLPKGVIGGLRFNPTGSRLALSFNTPTSVGDLYTLDLAQNKTERWTYSETGGLNAKNFIAPTLVNYPTFDKDASGVQRKIPAFLYTPKGAGPFPVVMIIHGGPEGQSLPTFNSWTQYLVNELHFAVILPNVRGSTGYGKTYLKLDNAELRENSVRDIGALFDWIPSKPSLDASRVAVFGGSYGGYMSLATMTHFNDRLKCGVDLFGISNFVSFLKNTSPYRQDLRRVEYGDERDEKMRGVLERISPISSIGNITKPMFIFQGQNDPRVPLSESEQMLAALKAKGNTTWFVMAKDEGHGIAKKANRDYTYAAIALFLQHYLGR